MDQTENDAIFEEDCNDDELEVSNPDVSTEERDFKDLF